MRGIILAGGAGTRLYPITAQVNKHFAAVYDKPMIYYPFSTLLLAGIEEFLIITNPKDFAMFKSQLGNGDRFGVSITYEQQQEYGGIAEAFIIGKEFIGDQPVALILGDNLFYGPDFGRKLQAHQNPDGVHIFGAPVEDPQNYGVLEFDANNRIVSIEEKPKKPKSNYAVPGIYFYSPDVTEKVSQIGRSERGELEITDLNNLYLSECRLTATLLSRGNAWLDTGSPDSLHDAATYVRAVEKRQGLKIGCPEEVAWRMGLISSEALKDQIEDMPASQYRSYLERLLP